MPTRDGTAEWRGDIKSGSGTVALASGLFEGKYSFKTRFEDEPGTNPEELIGAAHAGCYSMAFSNVLSENGHVPESIRTTAKVHLGIVEGRPSLSKIDLVVEGSVPGISPEDFARLAKEAKEGCPVSRALAGVGEITLDAKLV